MLEKKCRGFNKAECRINALISGWLLDTFVSSRTETKTAQIFLLFLPFFSSPRETFLGIITTVYFNLALSRVIYLLLFRSLFLPAETLRKEKTRRQERMLRKNTRHAFLRVRICYQQKLSADGHVRAMRFTLYFYSQPILINDQCCVAFKRCSWHAC